MPAFSIARLSARAIRAKACRAFGAFALALPVMLQTGISAAIASPAISVIVDTGESRRATEHVSGDALAYGARYRVVIVPDSDRPLSASITGNKSLFQSSRVVAGRPIRLPFDGGWYTVPPRPGDIELQVAQDGRGSGHVIAPADPSTPPLAVFENVARPSGQRAATPLASPVSPVPAQDFQALFNRYRAVSLALNSTREPSPGRGNGVAVYRQASPSVVVVLTDSALGGGVVVAPGEVLTNWHVVENAKFINVAPKAPGVMVGPPRVLHEAKIVKYDQVADLALIRYGGGHPAPALKLGDESKLQVGHTVHAIGHPEREYWTYTQGVISQIRPSYKWAYGDGLQHSATVIQTQTPISPGSSGGPLLDDDANIVGITSYSTEPAQNLNFAISVSEIKRFLASNEDRIAPKIAAKTPPVPQAARAAAAAATCEPRAVGSSTDGPSGKTITLFDTNCSGRPNVASIAAKDGSRPEFALIDALGERRTAIKIVFNFRENANLWIFYGRRDGVPTAYGYEINGAGRPGRFVSVDGATR